MTDFKLVSDIKVGSRFRKDLRDLDMLAKSILETGLLHPVVINQNNELIAGARRLEACKTILGWKEVPVTILPLKEIIMGELHENIARKDFTMSERMDILNAIERERIGHRTSKERVADCTPFQEEYKGKKSRSILSQFTEVSERQISKEKFVVKAAQDNPNKFSSIVQKVDDEKLSVDSAYKDIKNELWREKQLAENAQLGQSWQLNSADNKLRLLKGDFREVAYRELKEDSVPLIFTDPPYNKLGIPIYKDLGNVAMKLLRSGGSLITYFNQTKLFEIGNMLLDTGLNYWWEFCVQHEGPDFSRYFDRQFVVRWKPLLWFVKGNRPINPSFPKSVNDGKKSFLHDLIESKKPDKRFNKLSQSPIEAEYVIKFLTAQNDLVVDPFLGAGTTAIACMNLERRFVGIDIAPMTLALARANLRHVGEAMNTCFSITI